MTYTAPHNVLQVLGDHTSEGDVEQWSFGLRFGEGNTLMGSGQVLTDELDEAALDGIQADLTTWWQQVGLRFPPATRLTGFKFNAVDVEGRYVNQSETFVRDMGPLPGSAQGGSLPPQIAIAVTLRTNAQRGLAARGRIYLPTPGLAVCDQGGRLQTDPRDGITNATALLLTNLSDWAGLDNNADYGRVCVMSKVGAGATRRVNRVDVGDVFDVMRSRRSSLRENRSPEALVNS